MNDLEIYITNEKEVIQTDEWEILTDSGWQSFGGIKKSTQDRLLKIFFIDGTDMLVTYKHKFLVNGDDFIFACDLEVGSKIYNGEIQNIEEVNKVNNVYDLLEVEGGNRFITNNVVSHNCAFVEHIDDIWKSSFPTLATGGSSILISCVTDDTYVYTNKGIKRVSSFIDRDRVKGYQIDQYSVLGMNKPRASDIMFNNGLSPIHKIETQHSMVKCSPKHKWWVWDGEYRWKETKDILAGDFVAIQYGMNLWGDNNDVSDFEPNHSSKIRNYFSPTKIDIDLAYFLGLFIAENGSIALTCGDDISSTFENIGLPYSSLDKVESKQLVEFLEFLGFDLSKKASEKVIPERLLEMSKTNIIALLQGIFDGGGWSRKDEGKVVIGLSSYELISQLRMILHNLGILTDYKKYTTEKVRVFSTQHRLMMNSKKFFEEVGFRFQRKQAKILSLPFDNKKDIIPNGKEILKENKLPLSGIGNKNIPRKTLLEKVGIIPGIVEETLKWVKVKSNEVIGEEEVFDFSLPDTDDEFCHSVIYNSMVGHQTPNGMGNFFHDKWKHCQPECPPDSRNNFDPTFVHWTQVDEFRGYFDTTNMNFQEIYSKAVLSDWYREQRPQFNDREWAQEFEGDFLGSGLTVVKPEVLKRAMENLKDPITKTGPLDCLWVWKEPEPHVRYIAAADVASGDGDDYSTIQVLDAGSGEQCAEFQGKMLIRDFADLCAEVGTLYNTALLIPEFNGLGKGLVQRLVYEIGYPLVYQTVNETTKKYAKHRFGWNTSAQTRPLLIEKIQSYFNSEMFVWHSRRLWNELTTFVWKDNVRAEADGTNNDDLIIALAIAAHNREAATLFMPTDVQITTHGREIAYDGISNITPDNMLVDPYSLEGIPLQEIQRKFDPDDPESVAGWLIS